MGDVTIQNLSYETLFDIALSLDLNSLNSFCLTNRQMASICADDQFWKNKFFGDFPMMKEFRSKLPWKEIYQRMIASDSINESIIVQDINYGVIDRGKFLLLWKKCLAITK